MENRKLQRERGRNAGKSFLIVSAMVMDLDMQEGKIQLELLFQSMKNCSLIMLILMCLFIQLLKQSDKWKKSMQDRRTIRLGYQILAGFFAFCMVFGYSFYRSNSWELVFGTPLQIVKSCIALAGYGCLFQAVIVCVFYMADHLDICSCQKKITGIWEWFLRYLEKYPFRTAFLTCLIVYLPYMILSYPGIFTCDTKIQIDNGYDALIRGKGELKNQHPVIHTLLLVAFTVLGDTVFSSTNMGLFLLSLIQAGLTMGAVAWTVRYLAECQVVPQWLAAVLAFFAFHPRIQNYLFLQVKDVWYGAFLMLFVVEFHRALTERYPKGRGWRKYLPLYLSMAGSFFFRQDGIYVLFLSLLTAAIFQKKKRRFFLRLLAGTFLCSMLYQQCILPACHVTDQNARQLFSIPFQQTARYLRDAGDDVTEEEAEAIAAVLDYEHLGELYNPNLSDPVKGTFNRDATLGEIVNYLKAWGTMFFRHPDIYVQATMNNLYGYFYPDGYTTEMQDYKGSLEYMKLSNEHQDLNLGYPESLSSWREGMESLREAFFQLPVLSVCNLSAAYVWTLLLLFLYNIRKGNRNGLLTTVPLLTVFLICMAGPTYGWYFRYLYSMVMCLPAAVFLSLSEGRDRD